MPDPDPQPPTESAAASPAETAAPGTALSAQGHPVRRWPFLFTLPLLFLLVALFWQSMQRNDPREQQARLLYLACTYYADKNKGRLPEDLTELVPLYLIDSGVEASLRLTTQYVNLQPGANFEVARLERRPILLERPEHAMGSPYVIRVRGNGELEHLDPKDPVIAKQLTDSTKNSDVP